MPRNGTGGYSLPNNSWNPAVNGAAATAADWQGLINDVAAAVQQSVSSDGQTPMTGSLNMGGFVISALGAPSGAGQSLRWEQLTKGADIASAATITIPIEGNVFHVTGTTQITTINDTYPGRITYLVFDGILVLKNSAGLALPGGADITTKAGEAYAILNDSPGVWRLVGYPTRVDVQVGAIPTQGFKNALINGNFVVNQALIGGTIVLAAGAYGHDQWKAGSGGCTYTFASAAGVTTLTISAGTLVQPIEGSSLATGTYTLSWGGTAQGKIGAGVFSASGVTGSVTGGANLNIEFGTGTLFKPQFEAGTNATPFDLRPVAVELALCQRYYQTSGGQIGYTNPGNNATVAQYLSTYLTVPMRTVPTLTLTQVNGIISSISATDRFITWHFLNASSVNNVWSWTANARL